jgi:FAD/FMN-containing dehydrogenase
MLDKSRISKLRSILKDKVITPEDKEYEDARKVWNGMIDKRPYLIVKCENEDDIIEALKFGKSEKLPIAIRGGGHNVAGFGTCDNGIVIDLSKMKEIKVDPNDKIAYAQPGLTWGEFDKETQKYSLATTGGLVSTTGIAGFSLGGGIGWLVRKYGLTIDNLRAVELLTADLKKVRASKYENQDLFYGVRGGGGNFGIVTKFEYNLHEVGPIVFGGVLIYKLEKSYEILKKIVKWQTENLTENITTLTVFMTAPPLPIIPKELQGLKVMALGACYVGEIKEGEKVMKPLRDLNPDADLLGPIPYLVLQSMFDAGAPKGINAYWKTSYLNYLNEESLKTLIGIANKMPMSFSQLHIHHLGGAVTKVPINETPFIHRDSPYVANIVGLWMDPIDKEKCIGWTRESFKLIQNFSNGAPYINFMAEHDKESVKSAYGEAYSRLVALKRKYDPENVFRINQNINPN